MNPLEELMTRSLDDGTDRLEWLRARQGRVTATMVAKAHIGGASARREILTESFTEPVEITGNRYIDRGHEREPIIAAWVAEHWVGMTGNSHLFHAVENRREAATPDGIGLSPGGTLSLLEIKTSKYDRSPDDPYFPRTGYREQMQWQMYVTGAEQTLYVWEQHDDDWETGPSLIHEEPRFAWIERDEELISQLRATAALMLAERDAMAAESDPAEPVDEELATLAAEVLDARKDEAAAKARLKAPWTRLLTAVAAREEFSAPAGRAMVTWSNRETTFTEPDLEAALAAEGGAALRQARDDAEAAWQAHLAQYTRTATRSLQKLTVTEPKPKAGDYSGEF